MNIRFLEPARNTENVRAHIGEILKNIPRYEQIAKGQKHKIAAQPPSSGL